MTHPLDNSDEYYTPVELFTPNYALERINPQIGGDLAVAKNNWKFNVEDVDYMKTNVNMIYSDLFENVPRWNVKVWKANEGGLPDEFAIVAESPFENTVLEKVTHPSPNGNYTIIEWRKEGSDIVAHRISTRHIYKFWCSNYDSVVAS